MDTKRIGNTCRYFNGVQNRKCRLGIKYDDVHDDNAPRFPRFACLNPDVMTCGRREYLTTDEIAKEEVRTQRTISLVEKGFSPCCEATLDTRQVIKSGRFKGHGPQLCSKCGKVVVWR